MAGAPPVLLGLGDSGRPVLSEPGGGSAEAFAHDARERAATRTALEHAYDQALTPIDRPFLIMPLMHWEALAGHDEAVWPFAKIIAAADGEDRELSQGFSSYEGQHRELIERCGCYPHRNQILGRASPPEDVAHVDDGGSSFGGG